MTDPWREPPSARVLEHLRRTGHAMTEHQIRQAVDKTTRPYRFWAALRELQDAEVVDCEQSGSGIRWWAT